jgi:hypothetical protein
MGKIGNTNCTESTIVTISRISLLTKSFPLSYFSYSGL